MLSNEDLDDDIIEKSTVSVSKRPGIMKRSLSSMITNAHESAFNSQAISNFEDLQEKVKKLPCHIAVGTFRQVDFLSCYVK